MSVEKKRIFIVDDEAKIGDLFVKVLKRDGYTAQAFSSPLSMLTAIDSEPSPHLVLTDLMMPRMGGIELLEALKERDLNVPVIIMTAHSSVQSAVEAMRLGAFHYLQKPVNLEEMRSLVKKALALYDPRKKEATEVESTARQGYPISGILGNSEDINEVRDTIRTIRSAPNTIVLLRGETGTGKNLAAQTIHDNSTYNAGRFIEINCAAMPDNLLEAELFGYEKGAFTDARDSKPGLLEVADGGTVFLDEIDSMSMALQAKLLSFLESRTFRRLGGLEEKRVTTRILCATNADLEQSVANRTFRKDLFFRINVVSIKLPPLRKLGNDLLLIADSIIVDLANEINNDVSGISEKAKEKLVRHSWPGNVRELRNVLERAAIFSNGSSLKAKDLLITPLDRFGEPLHEGAFKFREGATLEDVEKAYILYTLRGTHASYAEVAENLGISKKTLWDKRKRYDLDEKVQR